MPANVAVPTRPILVTPGRVAFVKFAPLTLLFPNVAPVKFVPDTSQLRKLIPERSNEPEKSADLAIAVGPSKYPLRIAQVPPPSLAPIVGNDDGTPIIPPPVEITPMRFAPVKFAPEMSAPVNVAFVKFAFERLALDIEIPFNEIPRRFADVKFTVGPTINILYIL